MYAIDVYVMYACTAINIDVCRLSSRGRAGRDCALLAHPYQSPPVTLHPVPLHPRTAVTVTVHTRSALSQTEHVGRQCTPVTIALYYVTCTRLAVQVMPA